LKKKNKISLIIPARYNSSRFPGKPLALILNKELILWVLEVCLKAVSKKFITVATDDKRIFNFVKFKKFNVLMTPKNCLTGTDRIAFASKKINAEIYINVQGDEPLINPADIKLIINVKKKFPSYVICGCVKLKKNEKKKNLNIPKVIFNEKNELIYISRNLIPGSKNENLEIDFYKQVCIYAFNKDELNQFFRFSRKSKLESIEDIEILRFFEINKKIKMIEFKNQSLAVDTKQDIRKIEKFINYQKKRLKF
jgi:3-deoxy-manno-octulosonate cytidylyltransferase (CMP-KDO synthetase)